MLKPTQSNFLKVKRYGESKLIEQSVQGLILLILFLTSLSVHLVLKFYCVNTGNQSLKDWRGLKISMPQ